MAMECESGQGEKRGASRLRLRLRVGTGTGIGVGVGDGWHKKPFCAVLCWLRGMDWVGLGWIVDECSNDIYFIRNFRLADVSKHPDSSYFLFA